MCSPSDSALSRRRFLAALAAGVGTVAWPVRTLGGTALPTVLSDYLRAVVHDLNAVAPDYPESFFFVTDLHNPSNHAYSGQMLAELTQLTRIWKTFCGGDLPGAYRRSGRTARVQKGESIVWYGWSAEGWVELCGAGAGPDRVEVRMAFSETGVAYGINGTSLVSARTGEATLPRGQGAAVTGVTGRGAGRLYAGGITGSCFDATNALAAAGGRVTVLAGTPAGVYPLVSANGASWRQRVSVEGPRETLCSLVPNGGDGLNVAVGPLPLDEGRCVLAFTVATNAVGFVRGLADETTGSDHMLFLNGGGRLVLSGENEISGGIVIEDGVLEILETNAVAASSEPLLWSETAIALSAKVDRLELVERVTTVEEPAGRVVRKEAFSPVLATGSSAAEPFVVRGNCKTSALTACPSA